MDQTTVYTSGVLNFIWILYDNASFCVGVDLKFWSLTSKFLKKYYIIFRIFKLIVNNWNIHSFDTNFAMAYYKILSLYSQIHLQNLTICCLYLIFRSKRISNERILKVFSWTMKILRKMRSKFWTKRHTHSARGNFPNKVLEMLSV